MAKKIVLPVELDVNLDSIKKIGGALQGALSSAKYIFNDEQKEKAQQLIGQIKNISDAYQAASAKGPISKKMYYAFRDQFELISKEAKKMGIDISKELKDNVRIFFSEDEIAEINKIEGEIDVLKEKLKGLRTKEVERKSFKDILRSEDIMSMPGFEELGMGTFKKLSSAETELQKRMADQQALYGKAKYRAKDDPERIAIEQKITLYQALLDAIKKQQTTELAAENTVQAEIDQTNKELERKQQELKGVEFVATETAKETANALKTNAESIERNTGKLNFMKALGIEGENVSIVGGFFTGIQSKFKNFIGGITSGILILNGLKRILNDTIKTVKELDAAFNEIAMVTTYTTKEVWNMRASFVEIAKTTGQSVVDITKLAGEFFRQGRSLSETLKLTEAAGIAAKVAGISAGDSVNYLTSAINGYKLAADQAMVVSDKFAALAASSATDYEELAIALSKVAAQAYSSGVNMDNLMGFIAKALETTREAPENIGTAFKTIFARMAELKDFGKTVEDGMDVNRVDKALSTIGISLTNQENELRNLDEVLIDVGKKWSSLNKNQKAYVATALAGTRQQTRLLAVFEDFDRTMELTEVSANSLGATFAQQEKYYNSIAYAQNRLTIAWQDFISSLGSSDLFIAFYDTLSNLVGVLNGLVVLFKNYSIVMIPLIASVGIFILMQKLQVKTTKELLDKIADKILLQGSSTWANYNEAASVGVLNGAITLLKLGFTKLWATIVGFFTTTNPIGWFVLLGVAIAGIALALDHAAKKNKRFTEAMRKSQAEIFNLRKEADELEGLLEKYNKLENSISKTNETRDEQNRLIQQMQDLLGEDVSLVDLTGEFNAKVVLDEIQKLRDKADETFNKSIQTSKSTYASIADAYKNQTDTIVRQQLLIQEAIDKGITTSSGKMITSYSEFLDLSKQERKSILDNAKLRLENLDKFTRIVNKEVDIIETYVNPDTMQTETRVIGTEFRDVEEVDTDKMNKAQALLDELYNQDFSNKPLAQQLELLQNMKIGSWPIDIKDALVSISPELSSVVSLMERFNVDINTLNTMVSESKLGQDQILQLNDALSATNLTQDQQTELLKDFMKEGDNFKVVENFANKYNKSIFETVALTQQLADAMSNVSFEKLDSGVKSLRSVSDNITKVNAMLLGEEEYDLAFMQEMINLYPDLTAEVINKGEISAATEKAIREDQKETLKTNIDLQIASLENDITLNDLEIKAYEDMLAKEELLNQLAIANGQDLAAMNLDQLKQQYAQYVNDKVRLETLGSREIAEADLESRLSSGIITVQQYDAQMAALNSTVGVTSAEFNKLFNTMVTTDGGGQGTTFKEKVQGAIDSLKDENITIRAQIANLQFLKNNIDKLTSSTKAGTEANKEYKAALDEIYIIQQKLLVLNQKLEELKNITENTDDGQEFINSILAQNEVIEEQIETLDDLSAAQKRAQDSLYSGLKPALKGTVEIIDGRLVPVMSKYSVLSSENQELVDDAVETYNSYSDAIDDNTNSINDYTKQLKENNQIIEDSVIETQKLILEAYKNAEEKKLDILRKGLDKEREILDKRKEMYDKAFSEEDYTNSLQDMATKREELITKLAALEGATDLASIQKRKELNDELDALNKDYNTTVRDYNREAVLDSLDQQSKELDAQQTAAEEAYEKLINDTEYLEQQVTDIMNGGVDNIVSYLKENLPEYSEAFSIERENIEDEWELIAEKGVAAMDIIEGNLPNLSPFLGDLQSIIDAYDQIAQDALTNPVTNNTGGTGGTGGSGNYTPPAKKYIFNNVTYDTEDLANKAKLSAETAAEKAYQQAIADQKAYTSSGIPNYSVLQAYNQKITTTKAEWDRLKSLKVIAARKGSLMDYTGLAMVHGTPSAPERVLSPIQTDLFDRMVKALEAKASALTSTSLVTPEGIHIGSINITTSELNTNQDFDAAGRTLAKAFQEAISTRGIAINKKR